MNKPYFTKYIDTPIEKVGKPVTSEDGLVTAQYAIIDLSAPKLFLCSTDMQPNDYLTEEVHIYHDGSFPPFKVIGEVSPNAIWVKEGMEFEWSELRTFMKHRSFPDMNYHTHIGLHWEGLNEEDIIKQTPKYTIIIQFKCPTCNTFH